MNIQKMISKKNCYIGQNQPKYVVIHETDNWSKGAGARAHATAMKNGNLAGTVHYYVDSKEIYHTLEHSDGAWAVGDGKGRYGITNRNSINVEICVNPESNYYIAVEKTAELAAMLLSQYGWDTGHLKRHYDASRKHCPRRILDEGLWENFEQRVLAYMHKKPDKKPAAKHLYRVRKGWKNIKSQLGAYEILENAKKNCPVGYYIYDEKGKRVWGNPKPGIQAKELADLDTTQFVKKVGPLFTADQKKSGVLASVSMAQFILESGWCESDLSQKANNCFGMKKNLSGNTWSGSAWDGHSVISMKTKEFENGQEITITAEFRKYPDVARSIADHSAYLVGAKNGKNLRYAGLKNEKNYKKAVKIIKSGGYATAPDYEKILCNLIEKYDLNQFNVKGEAKKTFKVKVNSDVLRIRTGAGTNYAWTGKYTGKGIFTITEEKNGWGKLKSGSGWICIDIDCVQRL